MKRSLLAAAAGCALALAGCGGSHHTSTTTAVSAPASACHGVTYTMGCVGKQQPVQLPTASPNALFGVDFVGAPSPQILKRDGVRFADSYLSGVPGKDWTRAQLNAYHAAGLATSFVFERAATDALGGCGEGLTDAHAALNEANALGAPKTTALPLAVDTDVSAAAVTPYFRCAHKVLGSREGAYGSYRVVTGLMAEGLGSCRTDYQTVAWSNGQRSCAGVYQYSINDNLSGLSPASVDFDRTNRADYGQWGGPVARIVCFGAGAQGNATCRAAHANVRKATAAAASSSRAYQARGCPVLAQRKAWFDRQLKQHPKVKTASRKRALAASRRQYAGRQCGLFAQRVRYFDGRAQAIKHRYS